MGLLDNLVDNYFVITKDGRKIYHPFPFCRGYIIPSEAVFRNMRKRLKNKIIFQLIFTQIGLFVGLSVGFKVLFFVLGPCIFLEFYWEYLHCRSWERNKW